LYRKHTGFVGGLKTFTAKDMLQRNPEEILRQAVWGMTNKSSLARHQMKKLKIYTADQHPHTAQNPQPLPAGTVRRTVVAKAK
jgi:large subunit ribosomal protein L13